MNFPFQAQPTLVYGRCGFFAWGYVDNTVADPGTPLTARADDPAAQQSYPGVLLDPPLLGSPPPDGFAPFAFRFDQVATNVNLMLVVSYKDKATMSTKDGDPAPIKCV
jgi:hypothetical protein